MKHIRSAAIKLFWVLLILAGIGGTLFAALPLPGVIPVLMYHLVGDKTSDSYGGGNLVTEKALEHQMSFLKKFNYRVITMDEYYKILTGEQKPKGREIVITFDDGDVSFDKLAVPILARFQMPLTMFLVSASLKDGANGSMTSKTVKELQAAHPWINFQSHSRTHPHLLEISSAQVKEELTASKKELTELLDKPVTDFCYPYGQFNAAILETVKEAGYRLAFTTGHKRLLGIEEGPFSMTRVKIDRNSDLAIVFWYQISGLHQMIKGTREKFRNAFRRS